MALTPHTRLGPYEIIGAIGSGGMGEVYKARDTRLDRTVAVKVLSAAIADDPGLRQRLEREARAISALDHPHICALFDVGREASTDYLVMQYLEGETLSARLTRGALPLNEALEIGSQMASALAAAHARGIVHRDLKPGNVMLTRSGARLLDFGLAKQHLPAVASGGPPADLTIATPLTGERTILGTLQYMAPEQLEGREVDARSDIFSLGAVLYEMLTGTRAFEGESAASVIAAILTSQPRSIATAAPLAPPSLGRVVERCLAKKPDDRWQSASDLAFELRSLADSRVLAGTTRVPSSPQEARRRRVRNLTVQILAVVAAAVATVLAERWFSRAFRTPPPARELRLSLLAPPAHEFSSDPADFKSDFSVSPDGRQVAFVAVDARGTRRLWVRNLASLNAQMLSGTEGARAPFWSPDGQQVGYVGPSGMYRVPAAGGTPQMIASMGASTFGASASWGRAGLIAFDRTVNGAGRTTSLFVVPASGGEAQPIARGQPVAGELAQRYPVFLTDGRRFLYQSWPAEPSARGIYLGSLDSDERTLIVKTGFRADLVAPDLVVYIRDRALVAQRLALDPPGLVGEPQTIIEGVALERIPGQATFAASESGVVLYRARSREVVSELRWIDRDNRRTQAAAAQASDITVSLAPDGRLAATTRIVTSAAIEERPPGNIWILDLLRGVATRLTLDSSAIDENPVWSPDGKRVAYASHQGGGLADVLVKSAAEGGRGQVVATGRENFHPIDWSPDGKHLLVQAYATGSGHDDLDIWVLPAAPWGKATPFVTAPLSQAQAQFSPDGRWVAYTSDESGRAEVYVRPFPSGESRRQISSDGGAQPRWRADGKEIFYVSPAGTIMAVAVGSPRNFTDSPPVALFTEPSLRISNSLFYYGGAAAYDVTPDGKRFLVNRMIREPTAGPIHVVVNGIKR